MPYKIMQHCFGENNTGGPVKVFQHLINLSSLKFSTIRQLQAAGGISFKLIIKFILKIKKEKPDLIHIRGLGNEGFHAALAAKISRVPRILISVHGTHRDLIKNTSPIKRWIVINFLENITLFCATDIVTVCEYASNRDFIKKHKKKLRGTIPNGAIIPDLLTSYEISKLKISLSISDNSRVGICVSRITSEKGYIFLSKALNKIDNEENSFTLLIVGGGDENGTIKKYYSGLKHINVDFVGHVDNVSKYLSVSDFFIFPSLHENLSNALIEAMSYGLPAIATRVGGNVEVINKGGGVLINSNDVESLALYIKDFISRPGYVRHLGFLARENIINNYSISKMVKSWEKLYLDILECENEKT